MRAQVNTGSSTAHPRLSEFVNKLSIQSILFKIEKSLVLRKNFNLNPNYRTPDSKMAEE